MATRVGSHEQPDEVRRACPPARATRETSTGVSGRGSAAGEVAALQRAAGNAGVSRLLTGQAAGSTGGLPAGLRVAVEGLSGLAMDDVTVRRGSGEPGRFGAEACTEGNQIHLGPGGERHLAHEAWHVVQQKQGRVPASPLFAGVRANLDTRLEREADEMGARALTAEAVAARLPSGAQAQRAATVLGQSRIPLQRASAPPVRQFACGSGKKKPKPQEMEEEQKEQGPGLDYSLVKLYHTYARLSQEDAGEQCEDAATEIATYLTENEIEFQCIGLLIWEDSKDNFPMNHYVVVVGDNVIDATAQQFPGLAAMIAPLDQWRKLFKKAMGKKLVKCQRGGLSACRKFAGIGALGLTYGKSVGEVL